MMLRSLNAVLGAGVLCAFGIAAVRTASAGDAPGPDYYLPEGVEYDPAVPTPRQVLGFEVGEWHARHDQLEEYFRELARRSERVTIEEYARTHELRPLLLLTITSPGNLARIDEIRTRHVESALGGARGANASRPVVVWLGYSVHGNEPSGGNASLLVAYHLAAARGPAAERLLSNSVVLIDPCINPDGFNRFAVWANMHRGRKLVGDPAHREHVEGWPSGRTNHYWFDLNRDWLLLVHPESRGRVKRFHQWKPNVLCDFHEMGSDNTFFFQPGVPTRKHPLIPSGNVELTRDISRYHARALDSLAVLYFTEEVFDDFYSGKGSTYPDANGGIGILFEQASSRGHLRETRNGELTFPFTIRNQLRTSLSTLDAAIEEREELLEYQTRFYESARSAAVEDAVRAYVFGDANDPARAAHLAGVLLRHEIEVFELAAPLVKDGASFEPGRAFFVPVDQPQYRLIKILFERRTAFEDTTFYDVSSWTLPLAFAMPVAELPPHEVSSGLSGARVIEIRPPAGRPPAEGAAYAYLFDWAPYYAPRALYRLLDAGVRARLSTRRFSARVVDSRGHEVVRRFDYGTIVIPAGGQEVPAPELRSLLDRAAGEDGVDVDAVRSGLTDEGVDLGSPNVEPLEQPRPALLVGRGVSAYEAGEVWHLLDQRFGMKVSLVDTLALGRVDLARYTHLILVDGSYRTLRDDDWNRIRGWTRAGGILVSTRGGARLAATRILERAARKREGRDARGAPEDTETPREAAAPAAPAAPEAAPYADFERRRNEKRISGAIFETLIDTTHPLGFGYRSSRLPVFRRGSAVMELESDPHANVLRYTADPLLSGYASETNERRIAGTAAAVATRLGRGTVIRIADDPNFRGFWFGTTKLFLNGLFFGGSIRDTSRGE